MKVYIPENELYNSVFLLQPSRPILCTTINEDGSIHVAPFSWINPVSQEPPQVALALLSKPKKRRTLENIERTCEFVVNIPDLSMADALVACSYKTKYGENKFIRAGFTCLPSIKVTPPGIKECRAHIECRLKCKFDTGDHTLLIADVLYAQYDEEAYSSNLMIRLDKFMPAIHVQNFVQENSQIHIFLGKGNSYVVDVPYFNPKLAKGS